MSSLKFGAFANHPNPTSQVPKDSKASANANKVDPNDCVPKRFALKYDPPTIIMEYLVPSSGKLYHHKMKIPLLASDSDTHSVLDTLKKKNTQYFATNKISEVQIKNFIDKLKKKLQSTETAAENKTTGGIKLGKLNPINSVKQTINTNDKGNSLANSDLNKAKGGLTLPTAKGTLSAEKSKKDDNGFWDFEDLDDFDDNENDVEVDYDNTNLNKLSNEELQKHKDKMSVMFNKNQKKPGDKGFEYDKQQDFVPNEEN